MAADVSAWSCAWQHSAFAEMGFYRRADGHAEQHFATRVTDGPGTAAAILDVALPQLRVLVREYGEATVTDVGAGDGTLLRQLSDRAPADLAARIHWRGIDVRPEPPSLPAGIDWITADIRTAAARPAPAPGVVIAHELLDDIPCDIVEVDDNGLLRLVTVDRATGTQYLGPGLDDDAGCREFDVDAAAARAWLALWWPRAEPAARLEVGSSRDAVWQSVAAMVDDGLAIAIDYGHVRADRGRGAWDGGTLAAFRAGRLVTPVPDGSCNITAHVALDACAAAAGASSTRLWEPAGGGLWWLVQEMGP